MPVVVVTSVVIAWCFEDETNPLDDAVLAEVSQTAAFVPAVWPFEMANVLANGLRRGRITTKDLQRILVFLGSLPIAVEDQLRPIAEMVETAMQTGLTSYDASYLHLAREQDLPIASHDKRILQAANDLGVQVFAA